MSLEIEIEFTLNGRRTRVKVPPTMTTLSMLREKFDLTGSRMQEQKVAKPRLQQLGILCDPPNTVPDRWADHVHVFHNPVVLAPRLKPDELVAVAREIGRRLQHTKGKAVFMIPTGGTGSYAKEGGPLRDPDGDRVFFDELKARLPRSIELIERDTHAEDPEFVKEAVTRLIAMMEEA